ncbi:MAG: PKD domain-containing protein [Flammeovirgaceae bacterium]
MGKKYNITQKLSLIVLLNFILFVSYGAPKKVFRVAPTISSFPGNACVGETITITGNHFTGTIDVTINGATAAFVVQDNMTIDATVPSGASSVGTISIQNGTGTTTSSSSFIAVALPTGTPTITTPDGTEFCAGGSVEITANGTLGSNEVYQWYEDGIEMTGENESTLSVTTAADYTLTIKNAVTGCQTAESGAVMIIENALPAGTPSITTAAGTEFCEGDTLEITANGTLGTNEEYQWLQDEVEMAGETNSTLEVIAGGDYTLIIRNTITGCETAPSAIETIIENPLPDQPTITAIGATTFCDGDEVTLVAPAGFSTYNWFLDGIAGGTNAQSQTVPTAGDYTLIVEDADGCASPVSAAVTVTVNSNPVIDPGTPPTICEGQSVNLNASATGGDGSYLYAWTPTDSLSDPTIRNPVAYPSFTTNYTVTVTDGNGCSDEDNLLITVNDTPVINLVSTDADHVICEEDEITFTATGPSGTVFEFFINNISQGAPSTTTTLTTTTLPVGDNDIRVTGTFNGCSITTQDITVTVDALTAVSIDHPTQSTYTTEQDTVELVGSPTGGVFSGPAVAGDVFYAENLGIGGPYTITYTYTNTAGCVSVATHDINITDTRAILLDETYCADAADVTLTITDVPNAPSLGISPSTHLLLAVRNITAGEASPMLTPYTFSPSSLTAGSYIVEAIYREIGTFRIIRFEEKVVVDSVPSISIDGLDAAYCYDNVTINFEASTNTGTFAWTGVSTGASNFDPTLDLNISGDPNQDTVHTVMLTYTDGNNCSNTASQVVTINALPDATFTGLDADYCFSDAAELLTSLQSGGTFTGAGITDNGDGTASFDPRTAFLTEEPDSTSALTVSFDIVYSYTNTNLCSDSTMQTVDVNELPDVGITRAGPGPFRQEFCFDASPMALEGMPTPGAGETGVLAGNGVIDLGTGFGGFDPSVAAVAAGATSPTDMNTFHTITYTFTDVNGCINTATEDFTVYKLPDVSFTGLNTDKAYCHNAAQILLTSDSIPDGINTFGEFELERLMGEDDRAIMDNGDGTAYFDPRMATRDVNADSTGGIDTEHIVVYEYEDANGCENSFQDTITVYSLPLLDITGVFDRDEFCYFDTTIVVTGVPTSAAGSFSGFGITDNGDGTANYQPDSAAFQAGRTNPVFMGQERNDIVYTYTDGNNCTNEIDIELRVNPLPNVSIQSVDSYYCFDEGIDNIEGNPAASSGISGVLTGNGVIDFGDGTGLFDPEIAASDVGITDPTASNSTHILTYTYRDNDGCVNSDSATTIVNALPTVSFTGLGDKNFCIDEDPVDLIGNPIGDEISTFGQFSITGIPDLDFDSKVNFNPQIAFNANAAPSDSVVKVPILYGYEDSFGCQNFISDTAIVRDLPTVFFSGYNASRTYCFNDASFTLTGRTPEGNPVTFFGEGIQVDNGDGTAIYNPKLAHTNLGLDSLTQTGFDEVKYAFTNANGCTDTARVTITILPLSEILNFTDQAVCFDEAINLNPLPTTGMATIFTGNGITDNGDGTALFDGEVAANVVGVTDPTAQVTTHEVTYTFTNNNGCTNAKTITLTVNPLPVVSFTGLGDREFCIDENEVTLTGTPQGDETNTFGEFFINGINDFDANSEVSFSPVLAYNAAAMPGDSVVVAPITFSYQDALGCVNTVEDSAIIYDKPTVFFSGFNPTRTYCFNDASFTLTGRTPEGNPVAFIGNGIQTDHADGTAVYSPRLAIENLGLDSLSDTGVDEVSYVFTDANGCTDTAKLTVTIRPLSAITNFTDQSLCFDGTLDLLPAPTNGMAAFFSGNGITDNGDGTAVFDATTAAAAIGVTEPTAQLTTHDVSYTFTNNNGCTNSKTITLTVNPLPVVNFSGLADEYCYDGETITLAGSPLGVTGSFAGNGIQIDFQNGTATYSPSKAAQLLGALNPTDFAVTDTVTYTFTDDNGCTNSFSDTVVINPLPSVSITGFENEYCYDAVADSLFGAPAVIAGTSGIFSGNGITDSPDGLLAENGDGIALFLPELAATQAGAPSATSQVTNHQITYTYTDVKGCSNAETVILRVNPLPSVTIVPVTLTYCYDAAPFQLTANPKDTTGVRSAVFSGRGVTDFLNGNAEFNPANAAMEAGITEPTSGNSDHTITYTYTDVNRCVNSDSITLTVFALPDVSFTLDNNGLNGQKEYCPSTEPFTLRSSLSELSNTLALFSGEGVIDFSQGLGTFDPNSAVVASGVDPNLNNTDTTRHIIRLFYTDANNCSNEVFDTLTINPLPRASFNMLNNCGVEPINFEGEGITNTTITDWFWDFGDNTNAVLQNPSHLFGAADFYNVSLRVTTDKECEDDTARIVQIGGKPTADLNFIRICFNDTVFFTDQSFVVNPAVDTISTWTWDFDDPGGAGSPASAQNPFHVYSDTGTYHVVFIIETNNGCRDTATQLIDILPVVPIDEFPYVESFEAGDGSWSSGGINDSWEHGVPAGNSIDFTPAGNRVWMTKLDSTYNVDEMSYVDGPCFDFGILDRPMISIKVWSDTDPSRDGAVLQFSEDDGLTWQNIGDLTSPYNWYDQNIAAQPGGSPSGNPAWTGQYGGWRTVRHELDDLKGRAVRLRVAFGSDAADDVTDGFAFDEVWIGERSKTVLVEHFTNSSTAADASVNPSLNAAINAFPVADVVAIQYHLESDAGQVPDPFNVYNPVDPSSRALYYGISATPSTVIDGALVNQADVSVNLLREKILGSPDLLGTAAFDLDLTFDALPNETLNARLEIQANDTIMGEVLVHFAVLERAVDLTTPTANGETRFEWIMKKLLPDGAGTSFNQTWFPNDQQTVTQSWELLDIENPDQIAVVAFIQQNNAGGVEENLEVYQAVYAQPSVVPPVVISGLDGELPKALQQTTLYPNPADDRLFVVFGGDVTEDYAWDLYNNLGQTLQTGAIRKGSNGFVVDTKSIPQGVYFVRVRTNDAQLVKKVVVNH